MKRKTKDFVQHLYHEVDDEQEAGRYIDEALPLIGVVVLNFNHLEKCLDAAICSQISYRANTMGLLIIHSMTYGAKVELFKRLSDDYHSTIGQKPPALAGLYEELKEMANLRNAVVHADWVNTDDKGYTYLRVKITAALNKSMCIYQRNLLNRLSMKSGPLTKSFHFILRSATTQICKDVGAARCAK